MSALQPVLDGGGDVFFRPEGRKVQPGPHQPADKRPDDFRPLDLRLRFRPDFKRQPVQEVNLARRKDDRQLVFDGRPGGWPDDGALDLFRGRLVGLCTFEDAVCLSES